MVCLLGSLVVCSGADTLVADANSNPYRAIPVRNVFNLHDPPPPPSPEANKPPPPKITPTGVTDILGKRMAMFKVMLPASPPNPAKETSFTMTEGERQGEIEVVEIDTKAGTIKFNNYGTIETKSLEKDGAKPPSGPAPAVAAAGVPGAPPPVNFGSPQPVPTANPGASGVTSFGNVGNAGMKTIPTRQLRLPTGGNPGLTVPGFGNPAQQQPQANAPANNMSAEEQIIHMEVERERTKGHVQSGNLPPLPPTPLTPQ